MAEVGVVASVIAIIQVADRIAGLCKFYIESLSDTPSDIRAILIEVSTLQTLFETLRFLITSDTSSSIILKLLSDQNGPVEGCLGCITELEKLFPSASTHVTGHSTRHSKKRKLNATYAILAWPLKAANAQRLLQKIIQYKTSISLVLTTELTQDIKNIKEKNDEMHTILTYSQRQEVYKWLQHTDPSPLHNKSCGNYEAGTGNWILRSPDWMKWLEAQHRCLWIHGIPGAGKTILSSFLIEQIKEQCNKSSNNKSIYAYYYCYFGRNQDEAAPFLRWIICQLCRQMDFIPSKVQKLHKTAGEPSLEELLTAVEVILQRCAVAYVVIDAMDESSPRTDLLKIIRDLATDARFSKIQILATSRDYIDIERVMEAFSTPVTMANPLVEEDIRIVVRSNLDSNGKFRRWPKDLLDEVEEAVTTGAKGMFRWAVCQLDILQRLKCEKNIVKNALAALPKTLDETYERLFLCIPQEEWSFVHRALQWVHYHNELYNGDGIPCSILLDAIQDNTDSLNDDSHDRYYDVDRLRELCGCLISVSTIEENMDTYFGTTDLVSFAHYTVREYLDSTRILKTPTAYFIIHTNIVKQKFAGIIIRQAQNMLLDKKWAPEQCQSLQHRYNSLRQDYEFYCIFSALFFLIQQQNDICKLDKLLDAVKSFLDPSKPHFDRLCLVTSWIEDKTEIFSMADITTEFQFFKIDWLTKPDKTDAAVLLHLLLLAEYLGPLLARKFLEQRIDKGFLSSQLNFIKPVRDVMSDFDVKFYEFNGSIIQIMAQCAFQNSDTFKLMLDYGVGHFDPSDILLSYIGSHNNDTDLLMRLLEAGADPNIKGYRVTPLQIATVSWNYNGVEILLQAGADPNCIGDINGIQWEDKTLLARFNILHGSSPLYICRKFDPIFWYGMSDSRESNFERVESLLLQYRAIEIGEE